MLKYHKFKKSKNILDPFSVGASKIGSLKNISYDSDLADTSIIEGIENKKNIDGAFNFKRIYWLNFFMLLFIGLIVGRTAFMQIVKGEHYYALAKGNRTKTERIEAKRGIIYDRNHNPLVMNVANFLLYIKPSELPKDIQEKNNILIDISKALDNVELYEITKKLQSIKRGSFEFFRPLFIADNIPYEKAIALYLKSDEWPGVILSNKTKRKYILPKLRKNALAVSDERAINKTENVLQDTKNTKSLSLSHILGYTGKMNKKELEKFGTKNYLPIDYVGKIGTEYFWEKELKGISGQKQIEVDAVGRGKKIIDEKPAIDGNNIIISIDTELQRKIENIIKNNLEELNLNRASVIVLNPNNGQMLAMVSFPSYDNNLFAQGISFDQYNGLINHPDKPLFNRVISGEYPTGSTIKPVMVAAALEEGIVTEYTSFLSTGGIEIKEWFFPDWKTGGHGKVDARRAIAESINTYFYYIGGGYEDFKGLGVKRITEYEKLFGLGSRTNIDLVGEAKGFLPSKQWKKEVKNEPWYIGDTYHISIGQGDILATPLQVAMFTSVFANSGTLYKPHIVYKITSSDGKNVKYINKTPIRSNFIDSYNITVVRQGLRQAVKYGSARKLDDLRIEVAGKTGTAQWSTKKEPHAWFTGFAPYINPEIVITIIVEQGGEGSDVAVPIAKEILEWYFRNV